jgi:sulfonate transport system substrate-binding protein
MKRRVLKLREFLTLSLGAAALAALSPRARAEEIRIGTQKGGFFPAVKAPHAGRRV